MSSLSPAPVDGAVVSVKMGGRRRRHGVGRGEGEIVVTAGQVDDVVDANKKMDEGAVAGRRRRSRRAGQVAGPIDAGRRRRSRRAGQTEGGRRRRHRRAGQTAKVAGRRHRKH